MARTSSTSLKVILPDESTFAKPLPAGEYREYRYYGITVVSSGKPSGLSTFAGKDLRPITRSAPTHFKGGGATLRAAVRLFDALRDRLREKGARVFLPPPPSGTRRRGAPRYRAAVSRRSRSSLPAGPNRWRQQRHHHYQRSRAGHVGRKHGERERERANRTQVRP